MNHLDPNGLELIAPETYCGPDCPNTSDDGGGGGGGGDCFILAFDDNGDPVYDCGDPGGPGPDPPSPEPCSGANGLTSDQVAAVQTVLGENSWYLIGHRSYKPSDTRGNPSGPKITRNDVYIEDVDMFSVLVNRTQTAGFPSTIGAVATQAGQFKGYAGGQTKFNLAIGSDEGSSLCNDLEDVVNAMQSVLASGSQLGKDYLFWKAIDQGSIGFHRYRPGDIYVANTAFGTAN